MKNLPSYFHLPFFQLLLPLFFSLMFVGCASRSDSAGSGGEQLDLVTDSDESSARKRARIRLELALGYFEQGKTTIALDELKQAISIEPNFSDSHNLRGLIYMRLNDFVTAQESFNRALSLKPADANVLHNLGWLKCQQAQYPQAFRYFEQAFAQPQYAERAKTWMIQGLCHVRAGSLKEAQMSLLKAYEFDAANPVTGYNLARVLLLQNETTRAQFYIRRLNNSELANAESLWLGIKVEKRLNNQEAYLQLAGQLEKRFAQSPETALYRRGAFDE
jgi:type IV pilus assembly protein PilF